MSILKIMDFAGKVVASVVCDDNGHPYRDDNGGWFPNNEYDLDGMHYETDDNGNIYRADGNYYPDDSFELNGEWYSTNENGEVNAR